MQDIKDMMEKDKLSAFLDELSQEVTKELQWSGVQSFSDVVTVTKHLLDYNINVFNQKSLGGSSHAASASQLSRIGKSKSESINKGVSSHLNILSSSHISTKKKSKTLPYFFCQGPHKVANYI